MARGVDVEGIERSEVGQGNNLVAWNSMVSQTLHFTFLRLS